jgi:putative ABC transport system permease protein
MLLLTGFASLAIFLALFGIYGALSYSVSLRTHELAIRQALGARARDLMLLVVKQGMSLVLIGIILGLTVALGATRVLTNMLYEIKPLDLMTFISVSLLVACVAALACYLPARRTLKVDPIVSLRSE